MPDDSQLDLTGETAKILGYDCRRYQFERRGETVEIWATDQLFPCEAYVTSGLRRFGPQTNEDQWPKLLKEMCARKNIFVLE